MKTIKYLFKRIFTTLFCLVNIGKIKICVNNGSYVFLCYATGMGGGVKIGNNTSINRCRFVFNGENNKVLIGNNVRLRNVTFWFEDDSNEIIIGDNTTMEGNNQLAACEGTSIIIGKDCMFARNVNLRTTDSHSIINENGKRINPAKNIIIGNHVWIGTDVLVLKGACIPGNCVVSAKALITSHGYEKNSIIGGVPAKQIRNNISWIRQRIHTEYEETH